MPHSVNGRAHRLLDALSDGDLPGHEARRILAKSGTRSGWHSGHRTLRHLEEKGYVRIIQDRDGDMVQITPDGWEALIRLDDGEEVE
jgi:DNA-binding PadR family transcriptional regulator